MPNNQNSVKAEAAERAGRVQGIGMTMLAIAGFIIIIAIALWGAINAIRLAPAFFGSWGNASSTAPLSLTANPKSASSGESVVLSWSAKETANVMTYVFSYQCKEGTALAAPAGTSTLPLPCEQGIAVGTSTSIVVIPSSSASSPTPIGIAITSVDKDRQRIAEATSTLTVLPATRASSTPSTPGKPTSKPPSTPTSPSAPATPADLVVTIMGAGLIDESGTFVSGTASSPTQIAAVQFDVRNAGGTASGTWYFSAQMPTSGQKSYQSATQPSMAPGAHTLYTLKFNRAASGTFSVSIDPSGQVKESNENNNAASIQINTSYPQYQY